MSRFVDRRGEEELVRALETWVHATPNLVAQVATLEFHDERRLQERLAHLERESPRPGLRRIEHALYCMGILPERLAPPRHEQDARTALPAMIDVIWPTTTEEGILRMELSSLIGAEPWRGTWESCALRSATFTCLGSVHFQVDDAGGARLAEMLNQEFVTRARGQPCPPNVAEFISHRSREYLKAVQKGNPRSELMWTPVVAGTFAWYCRKTLDLRVRLIGAREFTIARVRLDAMLDAYRKGGQDR